MFRVVQRAQDIPKVDWAELKKQMPEQVAALDTLRKQWESLNISYGTVPENFQKEIDKWTQYNVYYTDFFLNFFFLSKHVYNLPNKRLKMGLNVLSKSKRNGLKRLLSNICIFIRILTIYCLT